MDVWGALTFFFIIFLFMSCCGYCCTTKKRGAILSTPVVVTSATHAAPGGYPVTQMPVPVGGYQTNVYASPYPQQMNANIQMPMPMPMSGTQQQGMYPPGPYPGAGAPYTAGGAPYPVAGPSAAPGNMNPPSYDMAIAGGGTGYPNNAGYEKQQPYNPSFTAH